jgi:DNA-binding winged helix-turn-helix (wHTH) protein
MPVPDDREDENQKSDQQQAGGFCGITRMPLTFGRGVFALRVNHRFIVRRAEAGRLGATLRLVGRASNRPMREFQGNHSRRSVRFGVFELDLSAGELRKNGSKLRLQEQPYQLLALLLERAGDVVTRDELRQKLWATDTFVDFDHSLNTAVNKLREALGDSASSPRYIETLARRGYRFIAPVQADFQQSKDAGEVSRLERNPPPNLTVTALHPDLDVPIPRRALTRGLFALVQLMYLIFYVAALFRIHAVMEIADSFLPGWGATVLVASIMATAGVGIPLRCYLLSAVGFDYQRLGEKFQRMFPLILALDQLWAVAPFLLTHKIGLGAAFAASAGLLYVPFSERTLIRMAYVPRTEVQADR